MTGTAAGSHNLGIGNRWSTYPTPAFTLDGDIYAVYLIKGAINSALQKELYERPSVIFKPRRTPKIYVGAAAGGLSIPIAAYHYNHNLKR
jgi:hypothetical protein